MPKYLDEPGLTRFYSNIADRPAYAFDTVAEMQAATYLEDGMICHTNGFHASGDGGAAYYKVNTTGTANGMDVLALQGGLKATLVVTEPYVTPEQFGAWGDRAHDDTAALQRTLSFGKSVALYGKYLFSETLFVTSNVSSEEDAELVCNADLQTHIVLGTSANDCLFKNISLNVDGNSKTGYLVALDYAHNSIITINATNVVECTFIDFYDSTGSLDNTLANHNFENNISINARGISVGANYFAYIGGGDNVYEDLQGYDFITGLFINGNGTQTIKNLHLWLLHGSLWENSTLIKGGSKAGKDQIKINASIIYQDTYRYGFDGVNCAISCDTWVEMVNTSIVDSTILTQYPQVTARTSYNTKANYIVGNIYNNIALNTPIISGQIAFAFKVLNPQAAAFYVHNANDVPIGSSVPVTKEASAADFSATNLPESNEMLVASLFSNRRIIQLATSVHQKLYFRTRAFWDGTSWSSWKEITMS